MTAADLRAAMAQWGVCGPPRPVSARENAVYRCELPGGTTAALRLHRPGYQMRAAIESELWWTGALAAAGLPVQRPIPGRDGVMVAQLPSGRMASAVTWLDGRPVGAAGRPLAGSVRQRSALFERIGALVARVHAASDRLTLPADFERPRWDLEGLLGAHPHWGPFWANPALGAEERALLLRMRVAGRERLSAWQAGGGDFGLIHADLMRENILCDDDLPRDGAPTDGGRLALIDFDDSGFGFRLYDLGTLMLQNLDDPAYPALLEAALSGYAGRRPSAAAVEDAEFFVTLRALASCGWAMSRLAPGDPMLRRYGERALRRATLSLGRA